MTVTGEDIGRTLQRVAAEVHAELGAVRRERDAFEAERDRHKENADAYQARLRDEVLSRTQNIADRDRYRAALEQIAGTVTLGGMSARIVDELILIAHRALNPPAAEPNYQDRRVTVRTVRGLLARVAPEIRGAVLESHGLKTFPASRSDALDDLGDLALRLDGQDPSYLERDQ